MVFLYGLPCGLREEETVMQIKGKYSWAKHLDFMIVDLVALLLSYVIAFYIKFDRFSMGSEWKRFIVIICLLNLVIDLVANPYSGIFRRRYYLEIGRTFVIVVANAVCTALIFYALKIGVMYSREVFLYTYIIYFFISLIFKYTWKKLLTSGVLAINTTKRIPLFLITLSGQEERDIHSVYATDLPLYEIKGIHLVDDPTRELPGFTYKEENETETIPVVGEAFVDYILDHNIGEVLVAVQPNLMDADAYQRLIANGVGVDMFVESLVGFQTEEQFVTHIGINKALSIGTFSFSPSQSFYLLVKRIFDILCGLIGVIVLIPITVGVKLAYLISGDTAKIFYRQKRVGLNGKPIRIWKFRSMVSNADEILQEMLKEERYRKEWEENQKFDNDPRITKVGGFIRKTSIDELPQLVNVLMGDMSLVGPRPLVEGELAFHNGLKLYEKVKPGITGWWGCNGRSNIDYRERLELEYYYVKHCSLYLDILCIIRTLFAVLKKDGAQ